MSQTLVVIDLDGTLLDTRARHHGCYSEALSSIGGTALPMPLFWRRKRAAASWSAILTESLGRSPREEEEAAFLAAWRARVEADDLLALDRLQPGAAGALRRLRDARWSCVLATARHQRGALDRQLAMLRLAEGFSRIIHTQGRAKAEAVADQLAGARPTLWIGDTEEDLVAAKALGARGVAVSNGIREARLLAIAQPDRISRSFAAAVRAELAG